MYFSGCSWAAWSRDNCYPKDHFQGNLTAERGATSADEIVSSTSWRPFLKLSYSTWTDACGTRRCTSFGVVGRHSRHIIEPATYIFSFYSVIRVTSIRCRWLSRVKSLNTSHTVNIGFRNHPPSEGSRFLNPARPLKQGSAVSLYTAHAQKLPGISLYRWV